MRRYLSFFLSFVIVLSLVFSVPSATYAATNTAESNSISSYLDDLGSLMQFIKDNYAGDITYDQMEEGAIKGILSSLDKYSTYFTKDEMDSFTESTSGTFTGVGMVVEQRDNDIVVVSTVDGSPAQKAGVKSGYIVVSVDGKDVTGMSVNDVTNLIKGEKGTKVKIGFLVNGKTVEYEITRDVIKINPVSYKIINGIGYIDISEFNGNTEDNVAKALDYMDQNNIKKLVIDLRDNPGGYLSEAVDVANFFVPAGPVVTVAMNGGNNQTYYSNLKNQKYKLAVLINGGTASAAEILAGAIQDTKAGILVGENSYGKGTVQEVFPFSDGSGIKLTIAKYLLPSGRWIDGTGLKPDVEVKDSRVALPELVYTKDIKKGDTGNDVKLLQSYLSLLGYYKGEPNGYFGNDTYDAIVSFQKYAGIPATGVLDRGTTDALSYFYGLTLKNDAQLNKAIELLNQ
ncbi:carboxyl-terminal protease [Thermoanaerobacterium thermosaccharolyticum DSM 571]|uniref:Carboxyl-terminal protease n=1 Tax=Thermoanaerobacterium thermosaccharolyticum (strain ATCC 7956 / DSM 571 / NCIMB 9385 / NCA 3814 / NCTC 13789 / WDCM 00135 / 2032) TaxID=580327 RepID=D9TM72_THETC|nr:S41 family peptidase [Thermoanaerobacterium thermosaccharolyticum]ADL70048.1 carboxyl-terminal protease [Thermoanaerobacterium thermosaccharolyticum DSM 571]